jgi:hypothetical protein
VSWPFTDIAETFSDHSLLLPVLNVLAPIPGLYDVLAIQPAGPITCSDDFVGHWDRAGAKAKFDSFINLAIERNSDLVLSPEYSLPWESLEAACREGRLPAAGKLWVLGCESVRPSELRALADRLPNLAVIYELMPQPSHTFVDAICYLMKTETTDGEPRHVALFQLKTIPMAGSSTFERDHLVLGSKRYYLHNRDSDYIRLIALICSEAVHLPIDDETALQFQQHPTVMIHSQLVDNARHEDMRRYRADLYTSTCSANLEVISLNWAREAAGTPINGTTRGNSCIFMKSEHFVRADERLERNHAQGMYYSNWKKYHTDISGFNYDEHVFHFANCRPALIGAAVQLRRTGPEMRSVFRWDEHSMAWQQCAKADDGFAGLCDAYHDPSLRLCTEGLSSPVHVERLLALSSGKLLPVPNWHDVRNLPSFEAEADERTKRLTFVHEQDAASNEFRNICLTRYIRLVSEVLGKPSSYPDCIADLSGSFRVVAPQIGNGFRQNIESTSPGSTGATAVFLGAQADGDARAFYDRLRLAWGQEEDRLRQEYSRRLVVWYERPAGGLQSLHQPLATITDDAEVPASILRGQDP